MRYNTHQAHIESLVFTGSEGLDEINDKLENILDQTDAITKTYKIDGAPAVVMWHTFKDYPDNSICLKSFVTSNKNCYSTPEEIEANYSTRPDLMKKLLFCLELAKYIPNGEAWQGDCLFIQDTLHKEQIDNEMFITFQPNKIIYAFPIDSDAANKITRSEFGIAFHTIYKGSLESKIQSFKVDLNRISCPNYFYLMDVSVGTVEMPDLKSLKQDFEALKYLEQPLYNSSEYGDLCNNAEFIKFWTLFENNNFSEQQTDKIELNNLKKNLTDFINKRLESDLYKKEKTLKTQYAKTRARLKFNSDIETLSTFVADNEQLLNKMVACFNQVIKIKLKLLDLMEGKKLDYNLYYNSLSQGYIKGVPEGVSVSDVDGNVVKFVDRSKFSFFNKNPDITAGFLHESLNEATAVVMFGRLNPPTIGHEKLINKMKSLGGEPLIFLSHTQDSKKNPLSYEDKVRFVEEAFDIEVVETSANDVYSVLHIVYDMGYNKCKYICGADRFDSLSKSIPKYNGVEVKDPNKFFDFKEIEVISAGERDADSSDEVEAASASKARVFAKNGDYENFSKIVPLENPRELYDKVREGLGILEESVFKNTEFEKHNFKYLDLVINDLISGKDILMQNGSKVPSKIEDAIPVETLFKTLSSEELEIKREELEALKQIPSNKDKAQKFEEITGLAWNKIYKGAYSKKTGGSAGRWAEELVDKNGSVKQEILNLLLKDLQKEDPTIVDLELVEAKPTGSENNKRELSYQALFGTLNHDDCGREIADEIFTCIIYREDSEEKKDFYLSVKTSKSNTSINQGLSKFSWEEVISPFMLESVNTNEKLSQVLEMIFGPTLYNAGNNYIIAANDYRIWYYDISNYIRSSALKNAIINSYGNGYYYLNISRNGKIEKLEPIANIRKEIERAQIKSLSAVVTQDSIKVQFFLDGNRHDLDWRRTGEKSFVFHCYAPKPYENETFSKRRGHKIENIDDYEFKLEKKL